MISKYEEIVAKINKSEASLKQCHLKFSEWEEMYKNHPDKNSFNEYSVRWSSYKEKMIEDIRKDREAQIKLKLEIENFVSLNQPKRTNQQENNLGSRFLSSGINTTIPPNFMNPLTMPGIAPLGMMPHQQMQQPQLVPGMMNPMMAAAAAAAMMQMPQNMNWMPPMPQNPNQLNPNQTGHPSKLPFNQMMAARQLNSGMLAVPPFGTQIPPLHPTQTSSLDIKNVYKQLNTVPQVPQINSDQFVNNSSVSTMNENFNSDQKMTKNITNNLNIPHVQTDNNIESIKINGSSTNIPIGHVANQIQTNTNIYRNPVNNMVNDQPYVIKDQMVDQHLNKLDKPNSNFYTHPSNDNSQERQSYIDEKKHMPLQNQVMNNNFQNFLQPEPFMHFGEPSQDNNKNFQPIFNPYQEQGLMIGNESMNIDSKSAIEEPTPTIIPLEALIDPQDRKLRPKITVLVRGMPGTGKEKIAEAIVGLEVANGGEEDSIKIISIYDIIDYINDEKLNTLEKINAAHQEIVKVYKRMIDHYDFIVIVGIFDLDLKIFDIAQQSLGKNLDIFVVEVPHNLERTTSPSTKIQMDAQLIHEMQMNWQLTPTEFYILDIRSIAGDIL
ncbi:MAG: nucleic acid-templated transcription [Marteilia pararefringens]